MLLILLVIANKSIYYLFKIVCSFFVLVPDVVSFYCFSASMSVAADSWLAFMDRLLMLRDDDVDGMHSLKGKILHLIDIYYDALDAPKSGKKVSLT